MKKIAQISIRLYQSFISPFFPPCCRFYPTCSQYAWEVFERFGFFRGLLLTVWRLLRCHPFCAGGYDPPPKHFPWPGKNNRKGALRWKKMSF